jgi:hypothetical protein
VQPVRCGEFVATLDEDHGHVSGLYPPPGLGFDADFDRVNSVGQFRAGRLENRSGHEGGSAFASRMCFKEFGNRLRSDGTIDLIDADEVTGSLIRDSADLDRGVPRAPRERIHRGPTSLGIATRCDQRRLAIERAGQGESNVAGECDHGIGWADTAGEDKFELAIVSRTVRISWRLQCEKCEDG